MDEFPHEVTILTYQDRVSDGGGGYLPAEWVPFTTLMGFVDTPSSRERYQAQQLQNPLDRNLYFPYRTDIKPSMRVLYDSDTYEIKGKPMDQGGMNEVMMVPLAVV